MSKRPWLGKPRLIDKIDTATSGMDVEAARNSVPTNVLPNPVNSAKLFANVGSNNAAATITMANSVKRRIDVCLALWFVLQHCSFLYTISSNTGLRISW